MKDASKRRARRRGPGPEEAPEGMDGLVSATECTGLSPAAVPDADEAQAYAAEDQRHKEEAESRYRAGARGASGGAQDDSEDGAQDAQFTPKNGGTEE